jgi:hypothetical protein
LICLLERERERQRDREQPFERERVRNFDRHYYCLQVSVTFGVANSSLISDSVVYMWWNVAIPVTAQVLKFAGLRHTDRQTVARVP